MTLIYKVVNLHLSAGGMLSERSNATGPEYWISWRKLKGFKHEFLFGSEIHEITNVECRSILLIHHSQHPDEMEPMEYSVL